MTWSWAVKGRGQHHPAPGPPPPGGTQRTQAMTGGRRSKRWAPGNVAAKYSFFWKTIKMFLFWFGKYLSFSIHHQFASTWILQSKINTKLSLHYEAVHHWTMLGITILCVRTLQLPRTRPGGTWSRRRSVRINYYFISNYHFFSSQKIVVIQQNI